MLEICVRAIFFDLIVVMFHSSSLLMLFTDFVHITSIIATVQVKNYHMGFMEVPRSGLEAPQLVLL